MTPAGEQAEGHVAATARLRLTRHSITPGRLRGLDGVSPYLSHHSPLPLREA